MDDEDEMYARIFSSETEEQDWHQVNDERKEQSFCKKSRLYTLFTRLIIARNEKATKKESP